MKYFCYQSSEHDCGYASLKMLFAIITRNKNYLYLPKESGGEQFSFLDLIEIAATHQVNLRAFEMEFNKIHEQSFPIMVELNGNHIAVLTRVRKNVYYLNDPSRGVIKMKEDEFRKVYSGHALIVENENLDRKYKAKKPRLMPKTYVFVHLIIGVLLITMLGLDFYLMNLQENIPFIFMLIMFLIMIEVFENWYLLKMSDSFDQKYIPLYFRKAKYQNNEEYKRYLDVKSNLFISSKTIIVYSSIAIILGVLISINDARNLLCIALIALYKAIERYITQYKDEKTIHELSVGEASAFDHEEQTVSTLIHLNQKANQHALNLTTRNCFFQLVLMLLTLFMMILSKNMSANYAVFHFGIYFIIGQGISLLFERITNHQEHIKNRTQFYDRCGL